MENWFIGFILAAIAGWVIYRKVANKPVNPFSGAGDKSREAKRK